MIATLAIVVFVLAGCTSVAVIATSVHNALPALRRLAAERRTLAEDLAQDRTYLFTLIETPPHDGTPAPAVAVNVARAAPAIGLRLVRHRAAGAPLPLRAAA
jgi:hypothetical protein